jgi:bifunctional UDP-N-acetylglucosamine pyrophosphorylase/glucosamine-1-phosphate N-acetyltransferase
MVPLSEDKFLLGFLGKSLLQHQIEQAGKAGLKEFILIGNPSNIDKVKAITQSISGASFAFAIQEKPLGMANALQSAEHLLHDEPVIVVNPNDVFESAAYKSILQNYKQDSTSSYILAQEVKEYFPGGYLVLGDEGEVKAIVEKPGKGNEPSNLVNMVVHLHIQPGKFLQYITTVVTSADDVYEQTLSSMIEKGYKIKAIRHNGFWKAIKYPWDIFSVTGYFLKRIKGNISPKAAISPTTIIEGEVLIEEGVRILENVVVRGPCYIGRDSIIGNNALIRDGSHIGEDCVVGYGTEIKHCYIGDRCWFHRNYFGDSIIGSDCSFGAGTVTANLRLDEGNIFVKVGNEPMDTGLNKLGALIGDGARTGINVSLMPGVRLGARCFVGPHVCLNQDLSVGKMVLATGDYKVVNDLPLSSSSLRGVSATKQSRSAGSRTPPDAEDRPRCYDSDEIATPSARNDIKKEAHNDAEGEKVED